MRAVVQRVERAEVRAEGSAVARIGPGLCALVGVAHVDTGADAEAIAAKIVDLRVFPDETGAMNRSVKEVDGSVLVVSQFTLYADARRGRRPSFTEAAPPTLAEPLVRLLAEAVAASGVTTETGCFGADMDVELVNRGPVTILLETRQGRLV